jgi:3-methylcrotonyl-CoA carboxylase alpha subunit
MHIVGIANNVDFLARLFANPSFTRAELDTCLIERERDRLFAHDAHYERVSNELLAFACARVLADDARGETDDPWSSTHGWRLNTRTRTLTQIEARRADVELEYSAAATAFAMVRCSLEIARADVRGWRSRSAAILRRRRGKEADECICRAPPSRAGPGGIAQSGEHEATGGRLTAPMPGRVIAVTTHAGARVARGTPLLVLEAMKMEHTIVAPGDGVVSELLYAVGDQVTEGAELVRFEAE